MPARSRSARCVLAPFVSPVVAGLGIAGFSGALLNLYWKTPGMHQPNDPRPTPQGTAISKDVWMARHRRRADRRRPARAGPRQEGRGLRDPAGQEARQAEPQGQEGGQEGTRRGPRTRRRGHQGCELRARPARAEGGEQGGREGSEAGQEGVLVRRRRQCAARSPRTRGPRSCRRSTTTVPSSPTRPSRPLMPPAAPSTSTARSWPSKAKQAADVARERRRRVRPRRGRARPSRPPTSPRGAVDDYAPVVAEQGQAGGRRRPRAPSTTTPRSWSRRPSRPATLAKDYADEYGPVVAKNAKQARDAAQAAAEQARVAGLRARDRVAG